MVIISRRQTKDGQSVSSYHDIAGFGDGVNLFTRQQVEPKVMYAQNVSMTKQYASSGNAEVAFLPLALMKPNEGRYLEVDEKLHQPIDQALGVVKASGKQEAARRFADFVFGEKGQRILEQYGCRKP